MPSMIIRWSHGVLPQVGHYNGTIFNQSTGGTANGTNGGGSTNPPTSQTIDPFAPNVAINSTQVFTTNLPATWTSSIGSIVAAADGLSATLTAPGSPISGTVTATNINDPGNSASSPVVVTTLGPTGIAGDIVPPSPVGRSIISG